MRALAAALLGLLWLSGCGGAPAKPSAIKPVAGAVVVREAKALIGKPYKYGGQDPRVGFDCSGLVWYVHKQHGSYLPRSTREQAKLGSEVRKQDLKPGDLVFFSIKGVKPSHVGIYAGRGRFVHAPSTGGRVREDELANNFWRKAWVGARRLE